MKQSFKILLSAFMTVVFCLSAFAFTPENAKAEGATFILDPGHGDDDPGASLGTRKEKDDVLKLALRVGEILSEVGNVVYTRTTDVFVELDDRCKIANELSASNKYFCSIHRNAYNGSASGVETYYKENGTAESAALAESVQSALAAVASWPNRGVKTAKFVVISNTNMPAILAEVGFIDNESDNNIFDRYFDDIAYAIASGIASNAGLSIHNPQINKKLDGNMPVDLGDNFYAQIRHPFTSLVVTAESGNAFVDTNKTSDSQIWLFTKQSDGSYVITSKENGEAITVENGIYADGTSLCLEPCNGSDEQKFYVYFFNERYYFKSAVTNSVWDIDLASSNLQFWGDTVIYFDGSIYNERHFELVILSIGDNWYTDLGDNFVASIKDSNGNNLTADDALCMMPENGTDSQKWLFTKSEIYIGAYEIQSLSKGTNVDVSCADIAVDTSVNLYGDNNTKAQSFYLIFVDDVLYIKPSHSVNVVGQNEDGTLALKSVNPLHGFTVTKNGVDQLQLKPSSKLQINDSYLEKVEANKKASDIIENFENQNVVIILPDGTEATEDSVVGTGSVVMIKSGDDVLDSVTVCILGDLDGNGNVNSTDYLRIKSGFLRNYKLSDLESKAADIDGNGSIATTDYLRVKSHFLKTFNIYE